MDNSDLAQASNENRFSKCVNKAFSDDFVEIPLFSDGENDVSGSCPDTAPQPSKCSLFELKSVTQAFLEPSCTPILRHVGSDLCSPLDDTNCQNSYEEDVEDYLKFNEDLANAIRHQCSLFSPSLVRDINSDIKEIKHSLTTGTSKDSKQIFSQNHESNTFSTSCRLAKAQHSRQLMNDKSSFRHRYRKHSGDHKRPEQSRHSFVKRKQNPLRARMIKSTGQSNGGDKDDVQVRQWTFAAPNNAVYSSSENGEDSESSNSPASPSPPLSQVVPQHEKKDTVTGVTSDSEWSLKRCPPCPRTSQPLPNRSVSIQDHETSGSQCKAQHAQISQTSEPDYGSDEDTDQLLNKQYRCDKPVEIPELKEEAEYLSVKKRRGREVAVHHPDFPDRLIEGYLYHCRYIGSTQLLCEDHLSKTNRLHQAQEAVQRVKAPDEETQPSVPVELFVSIERILILNRSLDEIVMDHDLRLVSYIADVGSILVLMVRRPHPQAQNHSPSDTVSPSAPSPSALLPSETSTDNAANDRNSAGSDVIITADAGHDRAPPKIICHLFESDETQLITQAIGKAFHEAYFEFLRQSGIEDPEAFQEQNYQNVLHQQEIFRNELAFFSDKEQEKEVIVPKQKGETLGVVIVESGWGSVLPTAVLANMHPSGPAARCGQLNIGNRIISINGQSLVGIPLATCQSLFKATKNQTAVKLVIVNCSPVVEVLIRRPDLNMQLGFSVQDGVICSLLRGGIAERGGIRVDHRIIEINGESVVAVPHECIVNLLATAVGEIYIRTMSTSIFRLLTGQDTPHYI